MRSREGVELQRRSWATACVCAAALVVAAGVCFAQTAAAPAKAAASEAAPAGAPATSPAGSPAASPAPASAPAPAAIGIVPPLPVTNALPGLGELSETGELPLDMKNIRNPFKPFFAFQDKSGKAGKGKGKAKGEKSLAPQTPLQRFALEDLKFVGVVWSRATLKGLIEDPTGRGYTVGPGILVGDRGGKIVKIHPDRMIVEEYGVDVLGEETVREITIQLHKSENEVNP